jgi:hypothetical protein
MAAEQVNVLALVSDQLPNPKDDQGGQYFGMTIMDPSNIVVVNTALGVKAELAKRDKIIKAMQKDIDYLKARYADPSKQKRARAGSATASEKRARKR